MSSYVRIAIPALVAAMFLLAGCAGNIPFNDGEKYAVEGDWDRAVYSYRQALREDPENVAYKTRLTRAIELATTYHNERAARYIREGNPDAAIYEANQALSYTPENGRTQQLLDQAVKLSGIKNTIAEARRLMEIDRPSDAVTKLYEVLDQHPDNKEAKRLVEEITEREVVLEESDFDLVLASQEPVTLSFKDANLKDIFEFMSKTYGISIIFDEDVKNSKVTVFARDVTFEQAIKLMLATNKLFMKKISDDAIIIIPKTKTKIDQYQDLAIKTFYLSNMEAKDMVNILRTMLEIRKIIINETLNSITMRESPEKIQLAEKLIEANDMKDAEVVIDVEVLSVDRNDSLDYGISLPKGATATYDPTGLGTDFGKTIVTNIAGLAVTGKGTEVIKNNVWFNYPSVSADWSQTRGKTETLTNPQIRTLNNKPAKILIGSRVPIQTGTTVSTTTTTSVEYREVGIKLTVEPKISLMNDVTLKTTLEVSSLGDPVDVGELGQRPRINTTTVEAILNLADGQTVIIGGLLENINAESMSGVAGVMDVPILGKIFSTNNVGPNSKRELIMTLTPHVVRSIAMPADGVSTFWSGTEEAYGTEPLFEKTRKRLSVPKPTEGSPAKNTEAKTSAQKIGTVGKVFIAPDIMEASVDQEVTIDVVAEEVDSVHEAPLEIIYNPKLLEFVTATEGNLLNIDGAPTKFEFTSNPNIGLATVLYTRLGRVDPVSGNGTVFSLTFRCTAAGIANIVVKRNTMKDPSGKTVPADLKPGTIYIR